MVKGEHLRPLLGFMLVCCTAALILASGLETPALRHIVATPHVPAASDVVHGQTLDGATRSPDDTSSQPARSTGSSGSGPSAEQRSSLVLSSFPQPVAQPAAAVTVSQSLVRPRRVAHHQRQHAAHPHISKPHASTTPAAHPTAKPTGSGTTTPGKGSGSVSSGGWPGKHHGNPVVKGHDNAWHSSHHWSATTTATPSRGEGRSEGAQHGNRGWHGSHANSADHGNRGNQGSHHADHGWQSQGNKGNKANKANRGNQGNQGDHIRGHGSHGSGSHGHGHH